MRVLLAVLLLVVTQAFGQVSNQAGAARIGATVTSGTAGRILYEGAGPVLADSANLTLDATNARLSAGTGGTTSAGLIIGYSGSSSYGSIWSTGQTPETANSDSFRTDGYSTVIRAPGGPTPTLGYPITFVNGTTTVGTIGGAAGVGLAVSAGTAASAVSALSITQTWNYAAAAITGVKWTFTDTSSHANTLAFQILGGASGTTNLLSMAKTPTLKIGESNGAAMGFVIGNDGSGAAGIWPTDVTPSATNFWVALSGSAYYNVPTGGAHTFRINNSDIGSIKVGGITLASGGYRLGSDVLFAAATAPTVASGGCTSPTAVTSNGTARWSVGVGTSCSGSQPLVFTLPATTTGWAVTCRNVTNGATSAPAQTGALSTTSVTITNFARTTGVAAAWTDSDVVECKALGG